MGCDGSTAANDRGSPQDLLMRLNAAELSNTHYQRLSDDLQRSVQARDARIEALQLAIVELRESQSNQDHVAVQMAQLRSRLDILTRENDALRLELSEMPQLRSRVRELELETAPPAPPEAPPTYEEALGDPNRARVPNDVRGAPPRHHRGRVTNARLTELAELMECPVCFDSYNDSAAVPTTFPCGHSTCLSHVPLLRGKCPKCRASIPPICHPAFALREAAVLISHMQLQTDIEPIAEQAPPAAMTTGAEDAQNPPAEIANTRQQSTGFVRGLSSVVFVEESSESSEDTTSSSSSSSDSDESASTHGRRRPFVQPSILQAIRERVPRQRPTCSVCGLVGCNTSLDRCCRCGDSRPYIAEGTYPTYVEGRGWQPRGRRADLYCTFCRQRDEQHYMSGWNRNARPAIPPTYTVPPPDALPSRLRADVSAPPPSDAPQAERSPTSFVAEGEVRRQWSPRSDGPDRVEAAVAVTVGTQEDTGGASGLDNAEAAASGPTANTDEINLDF